MRRRLLLSIFILSICATCGWADTADMSRAEKLFLEGKYEGVIRELDTLSGSKSFRREDAYYLKGLTQLKLGHFKEARNNFQDILLKFPVSKKGFDAYVGIGDSYFLESDMDQAIRAYKETIRKYPQDRNISMVHGRLEKCYGKAARADIDLKPQAVSETAPPGGSYSIQIGYFKSKKNAEGLAKKLSQKGYESYVDTSIDSDDKFYKSKVGKYKTRQAAEAVASSLRRAGYDTKICSESISE